MRKLKLAVLSDAIIYKLYLHAAEHGGALTELPLLANFSVIITSTFFKSAAQRLEAAELVNVTYPYDGSTHYEISGNGIDYVQAQLSEADSPIFSLKIHGDEWLDEVDGDAASIEIPASDRIVNLNDNNPDDLELIETLDKVFVEAQKNNEFGNLFADPDEKLIILSEFESGLSLVKSKKFRAASVSSLLVTTLTIIASRLPDAALGALASRALELLTKALGGL